MIMSLINVMVISVSDQQIFYYKPYEGCSSVAIVRAQEHLPERLQRLNDYASCFGVKRSPSLCNPSIMSCPVSIKALQWIDGDGRWWGF